MFFLFTSDIRHSDDEAEISSYIISLKSDVLTTIQSSRAKSTWNAYNNDWKIFLRFASKIKRCPLPASEESVLLFLEHIKRSTSSYHSVVRNSAAISAKHQVCLLPSPCTSVSIRLFIKATKRLLNKPSTQKKAMSKPVLVKILRFSVGHDVNLHIGTFLVSLEDWRYATFEFIAFLTISRFSDLQSLKFSDIKIYKHFATIFFAKRKNDQGGKGHTVISHLRLLFTKNS